MDERICSNVGKGVQITRYAMLIDLCKYERMGGGTNGLHVVLLSLKSLVCRVSWEYRSCRG